MARGTPESIQEFDLSSVQTRPTTRPLVLLALLVPIAALGASLGVYALLVSASLGPPLLSGGLRAAGILSLIIATLAASALIVSTKRLTPTRLFIRRSTVVFQGPATASLEVDLNGKDTRLVLLKIPDKSLPSGFRFGVRIPGTRSLPLTSQAYEAILEMTSAPSSQLVSSPLRPILGVERLLVRRQWNRPEHG